MTASTGGDTVTVPGIMSVPVASMVIGSRPRVAVTEAPSETRPVSKRPVPAGTTVMASPLVALPVALPVTRK